MYFIIIIIMVALTTNSNFYFRSKVMSQYYGFFSNCWATLSNLSWKIYKSSRCCAVNSYTVDGRFRWWNFFREKLPYITDFNQARTNGSIHYNEVDVGHRLERTSMAYLGRFKRNAECEKGPSYRWIIGFNIACGFLWSTNIQFNVN